MNEELVYEFNRFPKEFYILAVVTPTDMNTGDIEILLVEQFSPKLSGIYGKIAELDLNTGNYNKYKGVDVTEYYKVVQDYLNRIGYRKIPSLVQNVKDKPVQIWETREAYLCRPEAKEISTIVKDYEIMEKHADFNGKLIDTEKAWPILPFKNNKLDKNVTYYRINYELKDKSLEKNVHYKRLMK